MDEAASRFAVVSDVSGSSQNKQARSVLPFIPRRQLRQPPFGLFAVRWAGRAVEIWVFKEM